MISLKENNQIIIFDTTMRDGEQSPGASMNLEEKLKLAKTLESQLSAMSAEYQQGLQEYQENEATYNDLVRKDKEAEILGLQQRIQTFQQDAQQSLAAKEQELLEPILSKARKAIQEVAQEGNYTYIFDKTGGTILYANDSENILPLVKKKLGL